MVFARVAITDSTDNLAQSLYEAGWVRDHEKRRKDATVRLRST